MRKLSRIVGQLGVWLCNLCRYRNLTELEATLHREHVATVRRLLDALAASETERDRLRPAHDAETREKTKREQMEADCAVVCRRCREGESVCPDDVGEAVHPSPFGNVPCRAWDIRAAYAKAQPESGIKEANVAIVPYATVDGQPCDGNGRMLPEARGKEAERD